jgi:hypothetical protein
MPSMLRAPAGLTLETVQHLEQAAYQRAHESEFADMVTQLVDLLGVQLVAIIGGVTDGRRVRDWKSGARDPKDPQSEPTLRFALQLAIIITRDRTRSPRIAQAWFQGGNPILGYESPAVVLRNGPLDDIRPKLIDAARSFIGN